MPSLRCRMVSTELFEKLAVVADDQGGMRIFLQPRLEPQRAFEIEIVGRLVEQQQIGLGEQGGGERDAHAPAAGEFRHGPGKVLRGEAEPVQDFRRPRRRPVGIDGVELLIDFGHFFGFGGLQLRGQFLPQRVGGEDGVDQRHRRRRMLLIDRADPGALGQQNFAAERNQFAGDELEQGRFADAVAADQADLAAGRNGDARLVEEPAAPGVENKIVDLQHACAPKGLGRVGEEPLCNAGQRSWRAKNGGSRPGNCASSPRCRLYGDAATAGQVFRRFRA